VISVIGAGEDSAWVAGMFALLGEPDPFTHPITCCRASFGRRWDREGGICFDGLFHGGVDLGRINRYVNCWSSAGRAALSAETKRIPGAKAGNVENSYRVCQVVVKSYKYQ